MVRSVYPYTKVGALFRLSYDYKNATSAHAPSAIGDNLYFYDKNGNLTGEMDQNDVMTKKLIWDEADRLKAFNAREHLSCFAYDGGGDSTLKMDAAAGMVHGDLDRLELNAQTQFQNVLNSTITSLANESNEEDLIYVYHPDHLGCASFISNTAGMATQHIEYFPFGETFVDENVGTYNSPYKFNAKELDEESGLYYYGARYYDPRISVFLGVDPLSDKNPNISPFAYCGNNPVMLVDPDGRSANPVLDLDGNLLGTDSEGWKGKAIVMNKKDFKPGMDHNQAESKGTELDKYGKGIRVNDETWDKIESHGGEKMDPYVVNNSNSTVFYKPEGMQNGVNQNPGYDNSGAYPIGPNLDLYTPVDGVATSKYSDNVLKIPTGASITITSDGGGDIDFYGLGGIGRMAPGTGWINRGYITKENPKDKSWDALFNKASKIGSRKY